MQNKTKSCVYTNKIAKRQQIIAEMLYICNWIEAALSKTY